MSTKTKTIDTQKLFDILAKAELDDQIAFYYSLKEYLNQKISQRAKELEESANKYEEIKGQINSSNGTKKVPS